MRAIRRHSLAALSLTTIAVLGLLRVFDPFSGDQGLFLTFARMMRDGSVLYRDLWDIKQPGIFLFYLAGGSSFGFDQIGLHLADLAWQLAFSLTIVIALRRPLGVRSSAFAPLSIVGAYLAGSSPWHLFQAEELAAFPLFLVASCALVAANDSRGARVAAGISGIAAGVVLLFKLLFVAIVVGIVVPIGLVALRRLGKEAFAWRALTWLVGFTLPVAAFLTYEAAHHVIGETIRTAISLPLQIDAYGQRAPLSRLQDSALRFLLYYRGIVLLALFGLRSIGPGVRASWPRLCRWWIIAAIVTIVVQRESWWQYQFALLLPPLGILAAYGVREIAGGIARPWPARGAWLALGGVAAYVGFALAAMPFGAGERLLVARPFASIANLERYRDDASSEYARARADVRDVSLGDRSPFVFGDPLVYVLTGSRQAIAMNGWALQLYTPTMWDRLSTELARTQPSDIFVSRANYEWLLPLRSQATMRLLTSRYDVVRTTADGSWFRRR